MSDKPEIVYALSDPRNPSLPRYIGKTKTSPRRRLSAHRCWAKSHRDTPLGDWINSLSQISLVPTIYVLETLVDGAKQREEYWISFFRPLGTLTNRSNGDGPLGLKQGPPCKLNQDITRPILMACNEKRKKPVIAIETGQTFPSIREAVRELDCSYNGFKEAMKMGWKCRGVHWKILS